MQCERCGSPSPVGNRFCGQCGFGLTEEARKAQTIVVVNPNTMAGYLQSDAGRQNVGEFFGILRGWIVEAGKGFRTSLWVFAIVLGVSVLALVALGLAHALTASVGTVFGVLIGFVLAKLPAPGGNRGSQSQ